MGFTYTGVIGAGSYRTVNTFGDTLIEDGNWYHVTSVCDGIKISLYLDGKLDRSRRAVGTIVTNEYPVVIGENWQDIDHEFIGLIDDARIYSYALSAAEVQALHRSNGPGPIEKPMWAVSVGL